MVVEVGVRNGDPVRRMAQVYESVVRILAHAPVTVQIAVVDPDVGGHVEPDSVTVVGVNLADFHVANDDVGDLANLEADAFEGFAEMSAPCWALGHGEEQGKVESKWK